MKHRLIPAETMKEIYQRAGEQRLVAIDAIGWIDATVTTASDDEKILFRLLGGADLFYARAGILRSALGIKRKGAKVAA